MFMECSSTIGTMELDLPVAADRPLAVTYRTTDSLIPDSRNARTHPRRQIEQIVASIHSFGFTNPILIDPEDRIIAGHGRLLAAKALALTEVPTIALEGLTDAQKPPPAARRTYKIALGAGWDLDLLKLELSDLSDTRRRPVAHRILGRVRSTSSSRTSPTRTTRVNPALPETPRTQPGDIWILGEHRVGCGDGRDVAFLHSVIGEGRTVDAAFLDPPYNVRINGHANAKGRHREFGMASGEMTDDAFEAFLRESLGACAEVSRDGAVHFVCMDWRHRLRSRTVGEEVYGSLLNLCVWNKSNAGMGSLYRSKHELVFVFRVGTASHFNAVELGKAWSQPHQRVGLCLGQLDGRQPGARTWRSIRRSSRPRSWLDALQGRDPP